VFQDEVKELVAVEGRDQRLGDVLCAAGELMLRGFTRFEPDEQQTHSLPVLIANWVCLPAT
jgi:hypothetical protein